MNKKKAFTLAELLVVVVIIGVLAAVVLPKFNKVIETRKTTEAEDIMTAVRTEQEARCTLDKNYLGPQNVAQLASLPQEKGGNFTYTLQATGIEAASRSQSYTLSMPSYADGRICCSGEYCDSLNKDYPKCSSFTPAITNANCAAPELAMSDMLPRGISTNDPGEPGNSGNNPDDSDGPDGEDEVAPGCTVPADITPRENSCGCTGKGTTKGTFNTHDCKWEWTPCTERTINCDQKPCANMPKKEEMTIKEDCGTCKNEGYREKHYDPNFCVWGPWSECKNRKNCSGYFDENCQCHKCDASKGMRVNSDGTGCEPAIDCIAEGKVLIIDRPANGSLASPRARCVNCDSYAGLYGKSTDGTKETCESKCKLNKQTCAADGLVFYNTYTENCKCMACSAYAGNGFKAGDLTGSSSDGTIKTCSCANVSVATCKAEGKVFDRTPDGRCVCNPCGNYGLIGPSTTGTKEGCQENCKAKGLILYKDKCYSCEEWSGGALTGKSTDQTPYTCTCASVTKESCQAQGKSLVKPSHYEKSCWCGGTTCSITAADCAKQDGKVLLQQECRCVPCTHFSGWEGKSTDGTRAGCKACEE